MARNQEKAQSMLYRFREAQRAEMGIQTKDEKRPYLASLVDNIKDCERWRFQIIKEVSNLVSKIQDRGLNERRRTLDSDRT
jgi:pre-mRNA-splicing factor ISY1